MTFTVDILIFRLLSMFNLSRATLMFFRESWQSARITQEVPVRNQESNVWRISSLYSGYNGVRFDPTRDNLLSLRDEVAHNRLRSQMAHGVRICLV